MMAGCQLGESCLTTTIHKSTKDLEFGQDHRSIVYPVSSGGESGKRTACLLYSIPTFWSHIWWFFVTQYSYHYRARAVLVRDTFVLAGLQLAMARSLRSLSLLMRNVIQQSEASMMQQSRAYQGIERYSPKLFSKEKPIDRSAPVVPKNPYIEGVTIP